jgi:hypothetical protein
MTVSSTTVKNSYSGNGSTTVFAYTYRIFADSDLQVIIRSAAGTETTKTITTHYTVAGAGDANGGSVTFTPGNVPTATETVVLRREVPQTQAIDYIANDPFPAESHEEGLDRATMNIQQLQEEVDRSIKLSRTNTMTSTEFTVDAADRANKILAFDSSGEISVTQELGTYKGTSPTTTTEAFVVRDIVKGSTPAELNNIYICILASPVGTLLTNTTYWVLIVDAVSAAASATAAAASAVDAQSSEDDAAADLVLTNADVVLTHADVVLTHADVVLTNADAAATAADLVATNQDTIDTAADLVATNQDTIDTAADLVATNQDTIDTAADVVLTNADVLLTNADVVLTHADVVLTNADVVSTGLDKIATNADVVLTGADVISSAASAAAAAASADAFDDVYLGSKASDPTTDNDGDPLAAGMLYYNTTSSIMRIYSGSAWENVAVSTAGFATLAGVETLTNKTLTSPKINEDVVVTSTATELNKLDALSRGSILYGNASAVTSILTKGTAAQVLTSDGTDISWDDAFSGIAWQSVQTTVFTAVKGNAYPCDTTLAGFTVTLPATPSAGDQVQLVDYAGTFDTNLLTINPNGVNIEGGAGNLLLTGEREGVILTYIDSTQGWIATSGINEGTDALEPITYSADFLVVAGGGGGGAQANRAAGGGAGGYRNSFSTEASGGGGSSEASLTFVGGTVYTITVGAGGAGGTSGALASLNNGFNSSISGTGLTTVTSIAGGGGGNYSDTSSIANGQSGGSGGGGAGGSSVTSTPAGSGTANQGFAGGTGSAEYGTYSTGGGGGGASAVGTNGTSGTSGNGGNGLASSITGSSVTRAGGGAAYGTSSGAGTAGTGGGGAAISGDTGGAGTVNTGSGGGAGDIGGAGGSGVVILRMPTASYSGTVTGAETPIVDGSDTILIFNGSGSYTG